MTKNLIASLAGLVAAGTGVSLGATLTFETNAIGVGLFQEAGWSRSGTLSPFNISYARIESVSVRAFSGAMVETTTSGSGLSIVSGTAPFEFYLGGTLIHSPTLRPRGSTVNSTGGSFTLAGFDSDQGVGNVTPIQLNYGTARVVSLGGSGPNLMTNGSIKLTYHYDLIGLSPNDPISRVGTIGDFNVYSRIPTGRWASLPSGGTIQLNGFSGSLFERFTIAPVSGFLSTNPLILASPTGSSKDFSIFADGEFVGDFAYNEEIILPANASSVIADGLMDAAAINFSGGVDTNFIAGLATPIPEPSTASLLVSLAAGFLLKRSRCQTQK